MPNASFLNLKEIGAAILLSAAATCAVIAATDRSAADGLGVGTIVVNRTNKGDRLPQATPPRPLSSSLSPTTPAAPRNMPLGCDRAFSPVADPANAGIFLRCLS